MPTQEVGATLQKGAWFTNKKASETNLCLFQRLLKYAMDMGRWLLLPKLSFVLTGVKIFAWELVFLGIR